MKNKQIISPDLFSYTSQRKLRDAFYEALSLLTATQKEAVQNIDGPVMVLAGPGTGKTQVFAARYGYILDTTDTHINQILCLTYSEAGVVAMRNRLLQFIGPAAYEAHIFTYHAFCQKIINENPEYFFDFKKFKAATELQRYELIEQILLELPDDNRVKRIIGDTHYDVKRLDRQYDVIKKEQHDIDQLIQNTMNYIDSMAQNEEYINKKTKQLKRTYYDDKGRFERAIDALKTYHLYEEKMKANQWIDFNDMLIEVKKAFAKYPDLLSKYQEQYLYFLIDEFQDTNTIQSHIVLELCKFWPDPNLFVVGDDDQAIYRFQGANEQNLLEIIKKYPSMEVYCITESFRSTQKILDTANVVIKELPERFQNFQLDIPPDTLQKIDKKLIASGTHAENNDPIIRNFVNTHHETLAIYQYIKDQALQGANLAEIAIICRRFKSIDHLLSLLELDGIPISLKIGKDILEQPFIRHFLLLMRYLDAELHEKYSGEHLLIQLLLLPYWQLNLDDISLISYLERKNKDRKFLIDKIIDDHAWPDAKFNDKPAIKSFILKLQEWKTTLPPVKTLSSIVDELFRESGLLEWALRSEENTWHLRCYHTLSHTIRAASTARPGITLHSFLEELTKMENFEIGLQLEAGYTNQNGVNILTAHSAKGQEYDTVWIMNAHKNEWENFGAASEQPYKLPEGSRVQLEQLKKNKPHDERRLFYVAMTRARKNLIISWPNQSIELSEKSLYPSIFIEDIKKYLLLDPQPEAVSEQLLIDKLTLLNFKKNTPAELLNHTLIDDFTDRFVMSATDLNIYLECPRKFYFEQILKIPKPDNAHKGLGIAIHDALHEYFYQSLKDKSLEPEYLVEYFVNALKRNEWYFTNEEFNGLIRKFSKQLPLFLDQNKELWKDVKNYKLEYFIDKVQIQGVPLLGKIDQVLDYGDHSLVIDFKSGQGDSSSANKNLRDAKKSSGGDYYRQCLFYKILLDLDPAKNWQTKSAKVLFLQANKLNPEIFEAREYIFTSDELVNLSNQILTTYQKIMNHEFSEGCNDEECDWCNYIKDREAIRKQ